MRIGFIGTGNMGAPIALRLLRAGNELVVYDLRPEATAELESEGASRAQSVAEVAANAEVVFTSLPMPADVDRVALGDAGLLATMKPGSAFVDLTTNSPASVRRLAEEAGAREIGFLDAPVSGGVRGARKGTLAVMVGGDPDLFERCKPLFECFGSNVFHVGDVGAGEVAKLVNNLLAFMNMLSASEALVLGAKAGVDPSVLWRIVKASSGNSLIWELGMRTTLRNRLDPTFTLNMAAKDIGLATDLADELDVPLRMGSVAAKAIRLFQDQGFGDQDLLATIKTLEESAGTVVRGTWHE